MRIAVVGVGAAGAALLTHLSAAAANSWAGSEIWLFDEPATLGRGMAFGEALDAARINTRPDRLDLHASGRLTFTRWSDRRGAGMFDLDNNPIPRHVFGDYLVERMALAVNRLRLQGVLINVVPQQVKWIDAGSGGTLRVHAGGVTTALDRVVIATGAWSRSVPPELERHPDFINGMYPLTDMVRHGADCDNIGVLGMGLAAVDGVLALAKHCPGARIIMASRSGALPWVQAAPVTDGLGSAQLRHLTVDNIDRLHRTRRLRADSLLDLLRADLAEFGQDIDDVVSAQAWEKHWRDPLANTDDLRCHHALTRSNGALNHAFALLPARDRRRVREVLGSRWMCYRVRMPLGTWRLLRDLIASGRVVRMEGLADVQADESGIALLTNDSSVRVDRLVNGTGHGVHLRTSGAPLAALARAGAISVDEDGRGLVDAATCRALRTDGTAHPGLVVLGAGTAGTFFVTSALDVVVDQAVRASRYLARDMSERTLAA